MWQYITRRITTCTFVHCKENMSFLTTLNQHASDACTHPVRSVASLALRPKILSRRQKTDMAEERLVQNKLLEPSGNEKAHNVFFMGNRLSGLGTQNNTEALHDTEPRNAIFAVDNYAQFVFVLKQFQDRAFVIPLIFRKQAPSLESKGRLCMSLYISMIPNHLCSLFPGFSQTSWVLLQTCFTFIIISCFFDVWHEDFNISVIRDETLVIVMVVSQLLRLEAHSSLQVI